MDTSAPNSMVSVVIPAYNAGRYIGETLASVQGQTHADLEVIIIDDGSTDETARIVADAAKRDPRIQFHRQERSGVAVSRNRGIGLARAKWIAPLDADDVWHLRKLEKQCALLSQSASEVGLVYTWSRIISETGECTGEMTPSFQGEVFLPLLQANIVGHGSGPLIRRNCFEEVGGYDTTFYPKNAQGCEDWDLYLRIARKFGFAVVPEFLAFYRQVPESMSRQHRAMGRSYRLTMAKVRKEATGLPRMFLLWTESAFFDQLSTSSLEDGDYEFALFCLMRSCLLNPVRFMQRATYRRLLALLMPRTRRLVRGQQLRGEVSSDVPFKTKAPKGYLRPRVYDRCQEFVLSRAEKRWQASPMRRLAG